MTKHSWSAEKTKLYKKKYCFDCKIIKNIDFFYKSSTRYDGLSPSCRECARKYKVKQFKKIFRKISDDKDFGINYKYKSYLRGAKIRKIQFSIEKEDFAKFWKLPCYYCGDIIDSIGLDRKDSSKGYFLNNVVPSCSICNYMKMRMSEKDFIIQCKKILKFHK